MNRDKWNKADKVLAAAGGVFAVSLYAVARFPESVFLQGVHFCAEAALVGGIADWFAVTALFEKPFGFPYHTAILPRRRHEFMDAMVQLIRQEFFSHRKIFSLLKNMKLQQQAVGWLENEEIQAFIKKKLQAKIEREIADMDFSCTSTALAENIRGAIKEIPFSTALGWLCEQAEGEVGKDFLRELAAYLRVKAATPEMRNSIMLFLEKYQQEKTQAQGLMAQFLSGLASAMGVLNLDEAADIIQKNIILLLENTSAVNSAEHREFQQALIQELKALENNNAFISTFNCFRDNFAEALPLEDMLLESFEKIKKTTQVDVSSEDKALIVNQDSGSPALIIEEYLMGIFLQIPEKLLCDEMLHACFERLLHDASARCMLYAREISERIVRTVLADLSDEKLNQLVYEKVEPDMLWIRMNGSIVGSIVGLFIFIIMKVVESV